MSKLTQEERARVRAANAKTLDREYERALIQSHAARLQYQSMLDELVAEAAAAQQGHPTQPVNGQVTV